MPDSNRTVLVVETPAFLAGAQHVFTNEDRLALIEYLALLPASGDTLLGEPGLRIMDWVLDSAGSGGYVVYAYVENGGVVYLIAVLENRREADRLIQEESAAIMEIVANLTVAHYGEKSSQSPDGAA